MLSLIDVVCIGIDVRRSGRGSCFAEHDECGHPLSGGTAAVPDPGLFDGIISVGELKQHGDIGIGTFKSVNGEMIVLDGVVYQAVADGSM